jgi:4-hydroxy-tetrahydrodipicolinate reductase
MKLALIGRGKMGSLVAELAPGAGWEIVPLEAAEVAVDFTVPHAVIDNVRRAAGLGVNLVVGTTGWHDRLDEARRIVAERGAGLVYSANFSIGVNLFFRIIRQAAEWIGRRPEYDPWIWEMHHAAKKDAPSGTALKLAALLQEAYGDRPFSIASNRAGQVPGTHTVGWDAEGDSLTFTHTARSRKGFALGALWAAQWIRGRQGFYEFSEVLWEAQR